MQFRLNWLFMIFIYLSVNGQVFATAIHICPEMALTSNVLSVSQKTVNIHEHHQTSDHHDKNIHTSMHHDTSEPMDNCKCIDCDCVQNIAGQANSLLVQDTSLASCLPIIAKVLGKLNQDFISQPHTNPYRPPIVT